MWVGIGASKTVGTGLPGTFGVDYEFINESAIDVYVDQNHVSKQWIVLLPLFFNKLKLGQSVPCSIPA